LKLQANELFERIRDKIQEGKRYIFLRGSSRSGKTRAAVQTLILEALVNPSTTITIARETQVSIKNTILVDFQDEMMKLDLWEDKSYNKVDMVYRFDNSSVVRFIGLDDKTGKLRGMKSDIVMVDEVNTIEMNSFVQLDIRCEKYILTAYNPEIPTDWWGLDYEQKDNGCVLISTWRDNAFLEQRIIDSINSLRETDMDLWLIYSESQIVPPREIVYQKPEIYDEEPQGIKYTYFGIDFGFSSDPCAVIQVKVKDKELYVRELIYQQGLTNDDLLHIIRNECNLDRTHDIVADSAEPKSIEELNRGGLKVRGVSKGANSVLFGIQKVRQHKIFVHRDSHNLIQEFDNYRYKKDRSGRVTNQTQGMDHLLDALRYVVAEFIDNKPKKFAII
jgi:phage terminase large subunit